jgi:hypothetical protein
VTDSAVDALGTIAATTGMRAAADYLRLNGVTVADFQAATNVIREEIKAALDGALRDAKAALDANMRLAAEASFRASMAEAGIKAGRRIQSMQL